MTSVLARAIARYQAAQKKYDRQPTPAHGFQLREALARLGWAAEDEPISETEK